MYTGQGRAAWAEQSGAGECVPPSLQEGMGVLMGTRLCQETHTLALDEGSPRPAPRRSQD